MKLTMIPFALVCLATVSEAFCGDTYGQEQAVVQTSSQAATPTNTASVPIRSTSRIRFFSQNGFGVQFYENSACIGGNARETSIPGLKEAFLSFIGTIKNARIGIRDTPTTLDIEKRNGILSKAYFREYEVAADQPLTVRMSYGTPSDYKYCDWIGATLVPRAGKDYEASLDVGHGLCMLVIREIVDAADGGVQLRMVPLATAKSCD